MDKDKAVKIETEILNVLRKYSKADHEYINPHFLASITESLWSYYELEDDDVGDWIQDMYSA